MLAARNRFHGHGSLRFVYAKGQVARSKRFIVKYSANHRRERPRIAVVVSKKVIKSAVKRNRIRRRIYEAIRLELQSLNEQSDIVLIVTSADLQTIHFDELTSSLRQVFASANLYKSS